MLQMSRHVSEIGAGRRPFALRCRRIEPDLMREQQQPPFLAAGTQEYSSSMRRVGFQKARGSDVVLSSVLVH